MPASIEAILLRDAPPEATLELIPKNLPSCGVLEQLSNHDFLAQLCDRGIVNVEVPVKQVLTKVETEVMTPTARWAIFIVSHYL
jgi:hypothetical protein